MMAEERRLTDAEMAVGLRIIFQLTPQETNLMLLLLTMKYVPPELIYDKLNVATEIRVAMYRLRKALTRFNIQIQSKRTFGYWLTDETKVRVRAILSKDLKEEEITDHAH
jgi:hypothetical protein